MNNLGARVAHRLIKRTIIGCALFASSFSFADVFVVSVNITLIQKTCEVYGPGGPNQPIEVQFNQGNPMIVGQIDGVNYETNIPYSLNCEDTVGNPGLKLQFGGGGSGFNGNLLSTSDEHLGLQLKVSGSALNLGEWRNFNYMTKPTLTATPVTSNTPNDIQEGDFTASGTLSVEYQ